MDKIQALRSRIEKIKNALLKLGDFRPGSLSIQKRKRGGQYCQLSHMHREKSHTEYVRPHRRKIVERQVVNYRKFRDLTQEWIDLGLELCKLQEKESKDGEKS